MLFVDAVASAAAVEAVAEEVLCIAHEDGDGLVDGREKSMWWCLELGTLFAQAPAQAVRVGVQAQEAAAAAAADGCSVMSS